MSDSSSSTRNEEPIFTTVSRKNPEMKAAHAKAATSIPRFIEHLRSDVPGFRGAKLRFRDPDESGRLGKDQFLFLWLTGVHCHAEEKLFSGTFFEVPREFEKWHHSVERTAQDVEL